MNDSKFMIDSFRNPDSGYFPVYAWVWNEILDKDEIYRQIDEMYDRNILGVYIIPMPPEFRPNTMVTNMQPPYLSDGYFDMVKAAVDYATSKGMKFWIYDEAGWPSGCANFEVVKSNADFALVNIEDGEAKRLYNLPDLTNPDVTKKFIELTHEAYKEKLGESFKKLAPFVFTDEPFIRNMPFTETLKKEFLKRTGEELDFDKIKNRDDVEFNLRYHDVCSAVFAENYFEPIKKWCNDNGMMSTGHLNGEHDTLGFAYYGHHYAMRLLRLMDVPGIDVIWGQIVPDKECLFFPRLASSAAMQTGCGLALSESLSVYGSMSFEQIRYCVGYQFVRGINIINPMLLMYDDTGYYSIRQRPAFSVNLPGAEYVKEFNTYLASLQYIMQNGTPDTNAALYMPVRDFWANDSDTEAAAKAYDELGMQIERNHGQFDIADDDLILGCDDEALRNGSIKMGKAEYTVLYIPAFKYMPEEVRARIEIFKSGGGIVYYNDNAKFAPVMDISGDDGNLRVHKRKYKDCDIYLVFNESGKAVDANINMPPDSCEINVFEKKLYELCESYTFESGEIKVFASGSFDEKIEKPLFMGNTVCEISQFEMKPTKQFTVDAESMKYRDTDGKAVMTECGCWNDVMGDEFSGECEYRAQFSLEDTSEDIILDLGKVNYSCKVSLNGSDLGMCAMPPYRYTADKSILKNVNELVIKVSNTAANAFVAFDIPDEWEPKHVGPYHKICIPQEKNLIKSGLIGPVSIYKIM